MEVIFYLTDYKDERVVSVENASKIQGAVCVDSEFNILPMGYKLPNGYVKELKTQYDMGVMDKKRLNERLLKLVVMGEPIMKVMFEINFDDNSLVVKGTNIVLKEQDSGVAWESESFKTYFEGLLKSKLSLNRQPYINSIRMMIERLVGNHG